MKDETKAAFDKALQTYDTRKTEAAKAHQKQVTAREQFENQYRQVRDGVIVPALKEIATQILAPRGWQCDVQTNDKGIAATLEVYRGKMLGIDQRSRPHISFTADPHQAAMSVHTSTQNQGGSDGSCGLSGVTSEFVQEKVLKFFQRLVTEPGLG